MKWRWNFRSVYFIYRKYCMLSCDGWPFKWIFYLNFQLKQLDEKERHTSKHVIFRSMTDSSVYAMLPLLILLSLTFHRSAHFLENSAKTTCSSGCFFLCSSRQVCTKNAYAVIRPLGLPSACFPRPILAGWVTGICCRCWLFWLFCWWFCWIWCCCSCICWFCVSKKRHRKKNNRLVTCQNDGK